MKGLLIVLVLLAAAVVGLGFYLGWFHVSTGGTDGNHSAHYLGGPGENQSGQGSGRGEGEGFGGEGEGKNQRGGRRREVKGLPNPEFPEQGGVFPAAPLARAGAGRHDRH